MCKSNASSCSCGVCSTIEERKKLHGSAAHPTADQWKDWARTHRRRVKGKTAYDPDNGTTYAFSYTPSTLGVARLTRRPNLIGWNYGG